MFQNRIPSTGKSYRSLLRGKISPLGVIVCLHECRVDDCLSIGGVHKSRKFSLRMNTNSSLVTAAADVVASFLFTLFAAAIDIVRRLSTRA